MLGVLFAHVQAILKPSQGLLVDQLCRACRDSVDQLAILWIHGLWMPYCSGREAATPSPSCTVPEMATVQVRSAARAALVACLQGPPPDASEETWSQASGIQ